MIELNNYIGKKIKLTYKGMFGINEKIGKLMQDTEGKPLFFELHKRRGFYFEVEEKGLFFGNNEVLNIEVLK